MTDERFGSSDAFTVGIEEELLLVEPREHRLSHTSAAVIEAMGVDERRARHDLYAAQVELSSAPSSNADEATRELSELRARLHATGAKAIGAGIHPTAAFGDARIVDADRYLREAQNLRGIVQRTPDCALHVHVGMPDAKTAIRVCNALREQLPLLEALAANSPMWHGTDSGLASARRVLRRGFPRVGPPPVFRDYEDYRQTVDATVAAGELPDYTFIWWEVRPHPRLGTVEVRAMDSQSSLESVAAIAALVQGLAKHAAESEPVSANRQEVLLEASFRAGRDGVRATLHRDGSFRPVPDLVREALTLARPHARELGGETALEGVERILAEGCGADRQRSALERGGPAEVLRGLVAETEAAYR